MEAEAKRLKAEKKKQQKGLETIFERKLVDLANEISIVPVVFPPEMSQRTQSKLQKYAEEIGLKVEMDESNTKCNVFKKRISIQTSLGRASYMELSQIASSYIAAAVRQPMNTAANNVAIRASHPDNLSSKIKLTVPPVCNSLKFKSAREKLPIYKYRQNILDAIEVNKVTIISSETGKILESSITN